MIITIDGPAGAGKSTAARTLAERLGFEFLDTGAMYRAVALAALEAGVDRDDPEAMARLVRTLRLEIRGGRLYLNEQDVTQRIRTPEVTAATGAVASSGPVRARLVEDQRAFARGRSIVCEGRDQGTIVFPHAACKFFLVADPVERARRRQRDLEGRGHTIPLPEVLAAQELRDLQDAERDLAPMKPAPDAIRLDTTHLTLEQVVERMEQQVRRCQDGPPPSSTI